MTDLQALAALVRTLREEGVSTYEGEVPGSPARVVKLTLRPPDPPPKEPARQEPHEERPEPRRVPAGLGHLVT